METVVPLKVCARVRSSPSPDEISDDCVSVVSKTKLQIRQNAPSTLGRQAPPAAAPRTFEFDAVYNVNNQALFEDCVKEELLAAVLNGFNYSIFAYGQTGSGKTHTVYGEEDNLGITQRAIEAIFDRLENEDVTITVSHYEIYNEKVKDLLVKSGPELKVREHPTRGPFVEALSAIRVETKVEAQTMLNVGLSARTTGETIMNGRSSRSHALFQIDIALNKITGGDHGPAKLNSRITIVDLAGSEKSVKSQGNRLKETCSINTSLMTLGLVINALSSNSTCNNKESEEFVPYRNSVLTWLLRDSLGGNAKTTMIATISSSWRDVEESIATLRYAERAKNILNHAKVNEDSSSVLIRALRNEIETLQNKLKNRKSILLADVKEDEEMVRFSTVDALSEIKLQQSIENDEREELEKQLKLCRERIVELEKDSQERAELLWQSAESLRLQMQDAIEIARLEAVEKLKKQEEEEVIPLVQECSALRIQCCYRRFCYWREKRLRQREQDVLTAQRKKFEDIIQQLSEENAALKIQSLRHHRFQRELEKDATRAQEEVKKVMENFNQAESKTKKLTGDLAVAERSAQIQEKKRVEAEKKAKEEEKERERLLNEMLALKSGIIEKENRAKKEEKERIEAINLANSLATKVETLQQQLRSQQHNLKEREEKLTELNKLKVDLMVAEEKVQLEAKKNTESQSKMEELKKQVNEKEAQLKQVQEVLMEKRQAAEKEALELRIKVEKLENSLNENTNNEMQKMKELEQLNEAMREKDYESRKLMEKETNALRERIRALEDNAMDDMERLNRELRKKEAEAEAKAVRDTQAMRDKVAGLEKQLAEIKTSTSEDQKQKEKKLRQLEALNRDLEEREKEERERKTRELSEMRFLIKKLQTELENTKSITKSEVETRELKVQELERLNVALASAMEMKDGGVNNSSSHSNNASSVQEDRSMMLNQSSQLCLRLDVESYDVNSSLFHAVESKSVDGEGIRSFNVRSPLYDLQQSKWSRITLTIVQCNLKIEEVFNAKLEHRASGIVHQLKVVKIDYDKQNRVQICCDWDNKVHSSGEQHDNCFCFVRTKDTPLASGLMNFKVSFKLKGKEANTMNVEYPLQFKHVKDTVLSKLPHYLHASVTNSKAGDFERHSYMNCLWFQIPKVSLVHAFNKPIKDAKRIVCFSGYLLKKQKNAGGKVQRWFVFAPPFLLCYDDAKTAASDFSALRCIPHNANRGMILDKDSKITVNTQGAANNLGFDQIEFAVMTEEKTWYLQAANKDDLQRWVSILGTFVKKERQVVVNESFEKENSAIHQENVSNAHVSVKPKVTPQPQTAKPVGDGKMMSAAR